MLLLSYSLNINIMPFALRDQNITNFLLGISFQQAISDEEMLKF